MFRKLLVTAVLAATVGAAVAQPAEAFVTIGDQCAYASGRWIYWANEASNELTRNNFEETPYFNYAWSRVTYFGGLLSAYNCP